MFEFWKALVWISHYTLGLGKHTNKQGLVKSYLLKWSLWVFGSKNEGCPPGTQYEFVMIGVDSQMTSSTQPVMTFPSSPTAAMEEKDNLLSCKGKCISLRISKDFTDILQGHWQTGKESE